MSDRAEEVAARIVETVLCLVEQAIARPLLAETIRPMLRAYAEEARREEREACAALAKDWPAECLADPEQNCGVGIADAIRAQGEGKG